jgi:hypothetical protein
MLLFSACSPEKRLTRLLEKHPELKTIDTLTLSATVPGASYRDSLVFIPTIDSVAINTLLDSLDQEPNRRQSIKIIERMVPQIIEVKPVLDFNDEYDIYIYLENGMLKYELTVYPKQIVIKEPVEKIKLVKADKIDAIIKQLPYFFIALILLIVYAFLKRFLP